MVRRYSFAIWRPQKEKVWGSTGVRWQHLLYISQIIRVSNTTTNSWNECLTLQPKHQEFDRIASLCRFSVVEGTAARYSARSRFWEGKSTIWRENVWSFFKKGKRLKVYMPYVTWSICRWGSGTALAARSGSAAAARFEASVEPPAMIKLLLSNVNFFQFSVRTRADRKSQDSLGFCSADS